MANSPIKKCSGCAKRRQMLQQRNANAAKPFQRKAKVNQSVISNNKRFFK